MSLFWHRLRYDKLFQKLSIMFVLFIHLLLVYSASWWQPECRRTNTDHVGWRGLRTLYWILRVTDVTLLLLWNHMANKDILYNSYKMYCCDKWYKIANIICFFTLRKHAYLNILKILPSKNENFQIENSDIFFIFLPKHRLWVHVRTASARRFYRIPQSMLLSRNKKNNVYSCKPQFYYIKVGFKGVKII